MAHTPMAEGIKGGLADGRPRSRDPNFMKKNRVQSGVVQTRTVQY